MILFLFTYLSMQALLFSLTSVACLGSKILDRGAW